MLSSTRPSSARSCRSLQGVAYAAGDYPESRTRFTVIISPAVSSVSFITFVVCSVTHCGHSGFDPVQQECSGKWLFRDTLANYWRCSADLVKIDSFFKGSHVFDFSSAVTK